MTHSLVPGVPQGTLSEGLSYGKYQLGPSKDSEHSGTALERHWGMLGHHGAVQGSGLVWHKHLCQEPFLLYLHSTANTWPLHRASSNILTLTDEEICLQKDI